MLVLVVPAIEVHVVDGHSAAVETGQNEAVVHRYRHRTDRAFRWLK